MIKTSNKKPFRGYPYGIVQDKASPLKLRKKHYGKVEHNPFSSSESSYKRLLSTKRFEYDFAEINRIIDTESLVSFVFSKKKALILKDKPIYKSLRDDNVEYILKRITEIEYVSGITFYNLLETIVESLVNYNNAFILINRNEFSSSGLSVDGKPPIASLHVLSPTRLRPIVNMVGETTGYTYNSRGSHSYINIPATDVYHIYRDKKIDVSVGTPLLESVKDDILSLRQIEESIERLIYKNASPLIHAKVGSEKFPAGVLPDGTTELDYYANTISHMEDEGGLVTSHRVDLKLLGAESVALRIREYVDYYKARVLSGLRASTLDIGQSGTISTGAAAYVSTILRDDVEAYQRILERFFTTRLFNDLLLESPTYKGKNRVPANEEVAMGLVNPDKNAQIKYESHLANLVRFGLLTPEEFGRETGRDVPAQTTAVDTYSSASDGSFSSIVHPRNQHSVSVLDEATSTQHSVSVLDEVMEASNERVFQKLYYFIEDNIKEALHDIDVLDLVEELTQLILRYRKLGIDEDTISAVVVGVLEDIIIGEEEDHE